MEYDTNKIYYVYGYLDPRKPCADYNYCGIEFDHEPFYIGKGKEYRKLSHLDDNSDTFKVNKIKKLKRLELEPIIVELVSDVDEETAFNLEKQLIAEIGFWRGDKFGMKVGVLTNSIPGGSAPPKPIAGEFHTSRESENGTHWWIGCNHAKTYNDRRKEAGLPHYMQVRSDNNTHWWQGEGNPIHNREYNGNHWSQKQLCQLDIDNNLINKDFIGEVELTKDMAIDFGFMKLQNLYLSAVKRIKYHKLSGAYIKRVGEKKYSFRYYFVKTGNTELYYESDDLLFVKVENVC